MGFWAIALTTIGPAILYSLLDSIPRLVREFSDADKTRDLLESQLFLADVGADPNENIFDFIIVGAGTSGSLLAHRLSRDFKVLVLEAGGQPNPLMDIPGVSPLLINKPEVDWMYQTIPQKKSCFSLHNQISNWPRGKMEGGTSNINALIYLRGHPLDYEHWANLTGDPMWNYQSITNFFKRFENFVDDDDPDKGHSGELVIEEFSKTQGLLADFFVQAGIQAGYSETELNGNYDQGFDILKFTKKKGQRWEGYSAFLKPAKESDEHDLTVYKYSTVTKIFMEAMEEKFPLPNRITRNFMETRIIFVLMDRLNRAYGVEYIRHGVTQKAKASMEVILSAGAINTPQILMLSGVGPKKHLRSKGIRVKADRAGVGQNLQDHVGTYVGVFTIEEPMTFKVERDMNPEVLVEYMTEGTGPLSSAGVYAAGVVSTKYEIEKAKSESRKLWPDVQLSLIGHGVPGNFTVVAEEQNIKYEVLEEFWGPHREKDAFHVFVFPTRPEGRGEILLAEKDPLTKPIIDPKYLENKRDVEVTVEGIKLAVQIIENSTLFQSVGVQLSSIQLPPCAKLVHRSDEYWECYLRHLTLTLYHPSGTCKMGRRDDPNAVVDSELRVIGVESLRIVDASVSPTSISSNINAACNVIAELGAHLIKKKWKNKSSGVK